MGIMTPDSGDPHLAPCDGIMPVPTTGRATGSNFLETDRFEASCVRYPGGRDVVFGFEAPGRMSYFYATTKSSAFDTILHIYRGDCTATSELACNDETRYFTDVDHTSYLQFFDVPAGKYAIIIDDFTAPDYGDYNLEVYGELAPGEPCDPSLQFLPCEVGACADDGKGAFRCPVVLDCPDGIDADHDGTTDEDTCNNPPTVTCPQLPMPPQILYSTNLVASATDDGALLQQRWTLDIVPPGSNWQESAPYNDVSYVMTPDLVGPYTHR